MEKVLIIFAIVLLIASVIFITYLVLTRNKDNVEYVMYDFDAILKTLKQTDTIKDVINIIGFEPISQNDDELIYKIREMSINTYTKYVLKFEDGMFKSYYKIYGLKK